MERKKGRAEESKRNIQRQQGQQKDTQIERNRKSGKGQTESRKKEQEKKTLAKE